MPDRAKAGETTRAAGRPRDPDADDRILRATREILIEAGYEALSYEVVARRAGVTRPTIYRRWPSKAHLVYDAAFPATDIEPIKDTGDFAVDLQRFAASAAKAYARPETRAALPALLPQFVPGSALRDVARDPLTAAARRQFGNVVTAATERGQAREGLDADLLFNVIVGSVMFQLVFQEGWSASGPALLTDLLDLGIRPR